MTESEDNSPDVGQALVDLQRQLDEVIRNQSWSTENDPEDVSEGAKDSHRARTTGYQESMKKDLDELQNQVQVRMDQLENQLSLLATVMEEKPRTDSTTIIEGEPAKKSSVRDTVFGETPSNRKPAEKIRTNYYSAVQSAGKVYMKFTDWLQRQMSLFVMTALSFVAASFLKKINRKPR